MKWLKKRLKEKSTWIGAITTIAGIVGWNVSPELAGQIASVAVPVVGLVLMIINEKTSED
jgi:hypothetical protein